MLLLTPLPVILAQRLLRKSNLTVTTYGPELIAPAHIATTSGNVASVGSSNMGNQPTEFLADAVPTPTKGDLIDMFIKRQVDLWGFEAVQKMFDQGFEPMVMNGKVLWVK